MAYGRLVKEAYKEDPYSRQLFAHLHLKGPPPLRASLLAAPFQAAHLVACPHKILWKEGGAKELPQSS